MAMTDRSGLVCGVTGADFCVYAAETIVEGSTSAIAMAIANALPVIGALADIGMGIHELINLLAKPKFRGSLKPRPNTPNNGTVKCSGSARVLKGNPATVGKPGGFSGPSVGNVPVTANGAAVIPSQWGPSKAFLRPFLNQISGVFPNVNYSFTGIVDVMGGAPPPGFPPGSNVQTDLMQLNPGKLILELPGAPQDFGTTAVTITAPSAVGCPAGTVQVP
jgi:hypothetical protein